MDADDADADGDEDSDRGQPSLTNVKLALALAQDACTNAGLAGKPEALQCAVEQCSSILRLTLAMDPKSNKKDAPPAALLGAHTMQMCSSSGGANDVAIARPSCPNEFSLTCSCVRDAGQVADLAAGVLGSLLQSENFTTPSAALEMLSVLRPGLYGCVTMPRAADPIKPNQKVRDRTVAIFQQLDADVQPCALSVIQDCILRAPDKAPLRNMVAESTTSIASKLSAAQQASWLNFLAIALFSPQAATRLLALQALEPLVTSIMQKSVDDHTAGVRSSRPWPCSTVLTGTYHKSLSALIVCLRAGTVWCVPDVQRSSLTSTVNTAERCGSRGRCSAAALHAAVPCARLARPALRGQPLVGVFACHDGALEVLGGSTGGGQHCRMAAAAGACALPCALPGAGIRPDCSGGRAGRSSRCQVRQRVRFHALTYLFHIELVIMLEGIAHTTLS